jgi:hypothetical protein
LTNRDRRRLVLSTVLVGVGWVLAVWVARYVLIEWQVARSGGAGFVPPSAPAPNRIVLLLAGIGGLAAWWVAYWLRRAPRSRLSALAQWMAAIGVCVIGLATIYPVSVFQVPNHDITAFLSMYWFLLRVLYAGPLLLGAALCLPKLGLVVLGHPVTKPPVESAGDRLPGEQTEPRSASTIPGQAEELDSGL